MNDLRRLTLSLSLAVIGPVVAAQTPDVSIQEAVATSFAQSSTTAAVRQLISPSPSSPRAVNFRQGGPNGGNIRALAIHPGTPNILYAATIGGGVYKSTDGGQSWSAANSGLTSMLVATLAIDPVSPNTLYAGTIGGGVSKSTDGGSSWSAVISGLPVDSFLLNPPIISSLAIDPSNPDTLYAAVIGTEADGVYKSTDGGASWTISRQSNQPVLTLAIDPLESGTLYAGTTDGVYKSTDGGQSWAAVNSGLTASLVFEDLPGFVIIALAIDSTNPATIYAGTLGNGVFKTANAGTSWTAVSVGLPSIRLIFLPPVVTALIVDPSNRDTVYAGISAGNSTDGVFKSTDGGENWTSVNFDQAPTHVFALAIDPTSPGTVYAGCFGRGVFKSTSGGQSWNPINTGLTAAVVLALAIDAVNPGTVYAGTGDGVYKSTDGGQSWFSMSTGLANSFVMALGIDPTNPSILYAGTGIPGSAGSTGVFKTSNGGQSWTSISSGLPLEPLLSVVTSLAIDPTNPTTVYVGTLAGVFKTTDGGANWIPANSGLESATSTVVFLDFLGVLALSVDPSNPGTLYAVTAGEGIFKSSDGGANWVTVNSDLPFADVWTLVVDPSNPGTLYAVTAGDGVFQSIDGGTNWVGLSSGLVGAFIQAVAIDPVNSDTVYAATFQAGLRKTTDGAREWTSANSGLPVNTFSQSPDIQSIAVDPANPATLYVTARDPETFRDLVFRSTDGGQGWVPANSGLENAFNIGSPAFDPSNPSTLYLSTGGGVFKSTDGGQSWVPANSGLENTFNIGSLAIDPSNPSTLYVGTGGGVFKSTDGGQSWIPANSGLEITFNFDALAIDPSNPSTLYVGTGGGVFKSTDGGQSWVPANSGLENTFNIGSLAIDPSNPSTLYAGTGIGAFKSTDGGQSWAGLSGLMDLWVDMLVINPNNPATLYAATTTGLFKSTNGGESWNPANSDIPLAPTQEEFAEALSIVNALDLDPANAGTLYAGTLSGGVFKSTNSGRSWVEFNSGLPSMLSIPDRTTLPVVRLAVDPSNPSTIYLGTFGSGVFKSTDSASTWQPAGPTGNESTLYFAQFGNGTGLTSDIVLSNPSSTQTVMGTATFSSSDGSGFEVGLEGSSASSSVDLQVPPLGSTTISTDGQGDLAVGSAAVTSDNVLGGVVRFDISGIGIAGVGSSIPHSGFLVPVRRQAGGINTGIAMHNTGSQVVTLNLTLRNPQGEEVTGGTKTIVDFPAAGHLAQFINELFPDADTDEFEGVLVVEVTEGSVAATALEFGVNAGQFTTLPVTSTTGISASSQKLYFADFANGVGLISEMVLANPSATDTVSGQVDFFDGNGFPLTVSLTSGEASSVGFEIPASGVTKIASDGQGNLTIGSAVVNSEGTLGGVVRFNISAIGIAGVGASQPLSGFVTPVRRQAGGINTGVAIYNTESQPATLTLTLRDQDGTSIPNGTRSIQDFPAGGQLAQFIGGGGEVLLPDANMDDFEGTLVVEVTGGTIAAIALELGTQPGQFTTLPVTPLE